MSSLSLLPLSSSSHLLRKCFFLVHGSVRLTRCHTRTHTRSPSSPLLRTHTCAPRAPLLSHTHMRARTCATFTKALASMHFICVFFLVCIPTGKKTSTHEPEHRPATSYFHYTHNMCAHTHTHPHIFFVSRTLFCHTHIYTHPHSHSQTHTRTFTSPLTH